MPEQSYEGFQFERSKPFKFRYEGTPQDHASLAFQGEKLIVRKSLLWQRVFFALVSLALWTGILFCLFLAWEFTAIMRDGSLGGYTRVIILALVPLVTFFFIFVNILFHRKVR